jgi:hypothetical protein
LHPAILYGLPGFLFSGVCLKKLLPFLDDILYWLGAALMCAGAYCIHPVAALFVAGGFCLLFSYLIGKGRAKE